MVEENESQVRENYFDFKTQLVDYDPQKHEPLPYIPPAAQPPSPRQESPTISLLEETPRLDIPAINAEFQDEYDKLEEKSRELDLEFQTVVKELRIWMAASLEPATMEARTKIAKEIESIKRMEEEQEDVRVRIVDCMVAVEAALKFLNQRPEG